MALDQWALQQQLSGLLPLNEAELEQTLSYASTLPDSEAAGHFRGLLGDSPEASHFIGSYLEQRAQPSNKGIDVKHNEPRTLMDQLPSQSKQADSSQTQQSSSISKSQQPPAYAPPPMPPSQNGASRLAARNHTNALIEAAKVRAVDEQEMQQMLQSLQYSYGIYNSDIEPEHDTDYYCYCAIHQYQRRKWNRYGVQEMWSKAVMYPGERSYNDNNFGPQGSLFSTNPYKWKTVSPYGYNQITWGGPPRPKASWHAKSIHQTISLNNSLNKEAQAKVDAKEPKQNIWDEEALESAMSGMTINDDKRQSRQPSDAKLQKGKGADEKRRSLAPSVKDSGEKGRLSRFSSFKKTIGMKTSEEKAADHAQGLKGAILEEERNRWPDDQWRYIVEVYQEKVGMSEKIAELRARYPIQYLHLLRAGYFEPIPVAWANQASNPLKFSIEASAGWRGITPAWRGYEDTAEERLYWVLNHRAGSIGMRMKPDFISEMNMARDRMATAVDPPPLYFAADDTCHVQHTSEGYSKQVPPPPFRAFDRPEVASDDTMILLDVSGSMDFDPVRPVYDRYLITRFDRSTQPKNKDVAKAIIRRFTDAMANHDHNFGGYDFTTFSSQAKYIGTINHNNLDRMWRSNVRLGGGTRVMTGWQSVKELHFQKHSESATHHPVYGWQAGPETPMLRLLLLLDGEATDMDEFELDLLGLSWAHVTIFLIGVDGCPHHHRHANELQRISDVNHHVSFVDAQGNCPERFVTHELLKRHLGYDVSMQEFEHMEELPPYTE